MFLDITPCSHHPTACPINRDPLRLPCLPHTPSTSRTGHLTQGRCTQASGHSMGLRWAQTDTPSHHSKVLMKPRWVRGATSVCSRPSSRPPETDSPCLPPLLASRVLLWVSTELRVQTRVYTPLTNTCLRTRPHTPGRPPPHTRSPHPPSPHRKCLMFSIPLPTRQETPQ